MIIQELNSLYDGKNMFHFKEQNSIQNRIELFRHIHNTLFILCTNKRGFIIYFWPQAKPNDILK